MEHRHLTWTTEEALRELYRVVAAIPLTKFNMSVWYEEWENDDGSCGTVGCAAGWAAQDRWFRERGLTVEPFGPPRWEGHSGRAALAGRFALQAFFGLHRDTAHALFVPQVGTVSREAVLHNISLMLEGEEPDPYEDLLHLKDETA